MKKLLFIPILILAFSSCKKEQIQPTTLEIYVIDKNANPVSGATVTLYLTESDWANRSNAQQIETTQADGVATFVIEGTKYYWWVEGTCSSNRHSTNTSLLPLKENVATSINCQLLEEGTLYLENNSTSTYRVEVDGSFVGNFDGGEYLYKSLIKTGVYTVKVTQLNGYIFSPTINTYTVNVGKCETESLYFPF